MTRRRSNFDPVNATLASTAPPVWAIADAGLGTEHIRAEHTVWLGEDGELDPDKILREHGFDDVDRFSLLLKSIIAAHPSDDRSPDHRLEIAPRRTAWVQTACRS
jgi:hypothetical protein